MQSIISRMNVVLREKMYSAQICINRKEITKIDRATNWLIQR